MKLTSLVVLLVLGSFFLPLTSGVIPIGVMQIGGMKYNDLNADGFRETGEPGLANWTITLTPPAMGVPSTTSTAADGTYKFPNLTVQGTYMVTETAQPGWIQTGPANHYMQDPSLNDVSQADFGSVAWAWTNALGQIVEPRLIKDYYGDNHVFVRGSDNGLWDYYFGAWNSIGGSLASDPYPITNDATSKMQILVIGTDNALWVNTQDVSPTHTLTGVWNNLGGSVLSNPTAVIDPSNTDLLYAIVRGTDNNVRIRSLDLNDLSGTWGQVTSSGTATLDPSAIFDSQKKMHIFVTLTGGTVSDFVMDSSGKTQITQLNLAGAVAVSSPKVIVDPVDPKYLDVFVTGSDGAMWLYKLNTQTLAGQWKSLGGGPAVGNIIAAPGTLGINYNADPEISVAANGNIYAFAALSVTGNLMYNLIYTDGTNKWFDLATPVTADPGTRDDSLRNIVPFAIRNSVGGLQISP